MPQIKNWSKTKDIPTGDIVVFGDVYAWENKETGGHVSVSYESGEESDSSGGYTLYHNGDPVAMYNSRSEARGDAVDIMEEWTEESIDEY